MSKALPAPNDGLPASVQTEVTVLGACLLSQDAFNDALEMLSADDFSLDSHQKIFASISDLFETGNPVDMITVMEDLMRRKSLDAIGGAAYLAYLTEGIPRNPNIAAYCRIVKDKSVLRSLVALCDSSSARASDQSESPAEILGSIEERVLELSQNQNMKAFTTILDAVEGDGGPDNFIAKMCDPAKMTGLPTGYTDYDKMLGGLQKKELIIIAARPSMGKTAWAINIAQNVALKSDHVAAIFSLEMSKESLFKRIISSMAEVSSRRAQEGYISAEERRRMVSALIRIADKQLHIDDTASLTTMQMRARCRRLKQQLGRLDLIVVDYLQLMKGVGKHGNREQEVSSISRGLKALAKELDAPVVALSQLSRRSEERGDKRPMLSDLRESGSLEQDADVVTFIHRPEYYAATDDENVEKGVAEIITAKQRNGPTGTIRLAYQDVYTRFSNLDVHRSTDAY